ncbi:HAD family hydrolase [Kutzneria sp. CA-103260]|uniref:HAD family hydrolase n=1 Tax=Kutzneria sp. CA-103260 TaxID=2802641 RepID=UPI001BA784D8|nr:HAD family hydrolase [Kutzneria sp. CA-103260]QUQ66627.1 HAD-IB family hydrolase [Kutzneria sp. CA-103260]
MSETTQAARTFAFFDVDDTVVRIKTMFSFQDYYYTHTGLLPSVLGKRRAARFEAERQHYLATGRPREDLNRMYYRTWRGRRPERVAELARRWYEEVRAMPGGLYFPGALRALREHQEAGHEIVFVSGSMVDILRPIADELGVTRMLATRVVVEDGCYTGEIVPPQTIGAGKAEAVRMFLAAEAATGADCWAYGDDRSDVPMLSEVGHPVLVSDRAEIADLARERGWRLVQP